MQAQNQHFDFLIEPSFQTANILIVLAFKNTTNRITNTKYNEPNAKTTVVVIEPNAKTNVVLIEINFFDQPVKNEERTYINIPKITNGQWDDCTAGCQLDYPYFKQD